MRDHGSAQEAQASSHPAGPATSAAQRLRGTLSLPQQAFLHQHGYLILPKVLHPQAVAALRAELDRLAQVEGPYAVVPDPTAWQLWLERPDAVPARAVLKRMGQRLVSAWRDVAVRHAFRHLPSLKLKLRAAHGSPEFGRPQNRVSPALRKWPWVLRWAQELHRQWVVAAFTEQGVSRVCNLLNKSDRFDGLLANPQVLAGVGALLGDDFKLSSINGRAVQPGHGLQPLHADWEDAAPADQVLACNTLWVLDDYRADNGATRVVPGTHRSGQTPAQAVARLWDAHPDEVLIDAAAGSVILMNAHTWHGGTCNRSDHLRRVIQVYYVRRAYAQQCNQAQHLRDATRIRLTPDLKWLLGEGTSERASD